MLIIELKNPNVHVRLELLTMDKTLFVKIVVLNAKLVTKTNVFNVQEIESISLSVIVILKMGTIMTEMQIVQNVILNVKPVNLILNVPNALEIDYRLQFVNAKMDFLNKVKKPAQLVVISVQPVHLLVIVFLVVI